MLQTTKEEIPLAVELHNVENYISLQQMIASQPPCLYGQDGPAAERFPDSAPFYSDFCREFREARLLSRPLSAYPDKDPAVGEAHERFVNVTVLDDGKGFPDETLAQLNQPGYRDQAHIGISNVMRRFSLLYGGRYSFVFQNDSGSHIEFLFPMKRGILRFFAAEI